MADAVTSVGAIRAGDTITYIDHFGGESEGPASTAVLARLPLSVPIVRFH